MPTLDSRGTPGQGTAEAPDVTAAAQCLDVIYTHVPDRHNPTCCAACGWMYEHRLSCPRAERAYDELVSARLLDDSVQGAGDGPGTPCLGEPDRWDLDLSGPQDWRVAIELCSTCPLRGACAEQLLRHYPHAGKPGGGPQGVVWAGRAYNDSGTVLTARQLTARGRKSRPAPVPLPTNQETPMPETQHVRRIAVELPSPEVTPVEFVDGSQQWEQGWISAREGGGVVVVADDTVSASTARRWAACLLAAADSAEATAADSTETTAAGRQPIAS